MAEHRGQRIGYIASHLPRQDCRDALQARIKRPLARISRQALTGEVDEYAFNVKLNSLFQPAVVSFRGTFEPVNRGATISFSLQPGGLLFVTAYAQILVGFLIAAAQLAFPAVSAPIFGVFGLIALLAGIAGVVVLSRRARSDAQFDEVLVFLARTLSGRVVSAEEAERLTSGLANGPAW